MVMSKKIHQYTEVLDIEHFLTVKKFYWEIKPFNIITGDMGSGKSLCIKLLEFFESLLISSILLAPGFSKKLFENGTFFERLARTFKDRFYLADNFALPGLRINYVFRINGSEFNILLIWDGQLKWTCDYLTANLKKWSTYFTGTETPDMAKEVRNRIHEEIRHTFLDKLPVSPMFVPASRAALAVVGTNTSLTDFYLNGFAGDRDFFLSYPDISLKEEYTKILHVRNIKKNPKDEMDVVLEHDDGRVVPTLYSSSGQQELLYLLLLMEKLPKINFLYGGMLSIIIEEPSAHLFPKEQKDLIESIITLFRKEKELESRFFITTHSPYILNVINNTLKKGHLIDKIKTCNDGVLKKTIKEDIKELSFPHLMADEVSAFFIKNNDEAESMINESKNGSFLYEKMIEDITQCIDDDYNNVKRLLRQFEE
jgi:predicted ATPase